MLHVNTQLYSALTKEEVDDDGVNSVAASEDPSADDVKVSNRSSNEEQIDDCDNSEEGMLVKRDQVGRLSISRKKGPESKGNSAGESGSNGVHSREETVSSGGHGRLKGDNRVHDRPGGAANVVPVGNVVGVGVRA